MPRLWPDQVQFSAGEISPKLYGRTDVKQYFQGCRTLENWQVLPQGGAVKRAGTRFVAEVKDSDHPPRLLPFVYGVEQAYVIELGHDGGSGYMRFYKDQAQIISGTPVEITTPPWAEAELLEVMYAQSADSMYLAHPNQPPKVLTRSSHTSWSLSTYTVTSGKDPAPPFTGANDYPGAVTFIQQRLAWAASNNNPQKIWLSRTGDFLDLLAGSNDDDPFDATVASPRVNVGRWLLGGNGLFFGTAGAVWRVRTEAITPSNFPLQRVASAGCAFRQPIDVDDHLVYACRFGDPANQGRQLDGLRYNVDADNFVPDEISIISSHITDLGIKDLAWQEQPQRTLWLVLDDGTLASCTYLPHKEIIGWSRHLIAGVDAAVESVTTIPGANGDEVWLVVKRTVNGGTKRTVEVIDPASSPDNIYLDGAVAATASPATTAWSGLDHLEGEEVAILADDAPVASKTVTGGAITLDVAAEDTVIGLAYTATLATNDLGRGAPDGAAQGRMKSLGKLILQLKDSGGLSAAAKVGLAGDDIIFREVDDQVGQAIPLYTGPITLQPPTGWDRLGRITITSDQPLPATVLALIMRAEVND